MLGKIDVLIVNLLAFLAFAGLVALQVIEAGDLLGSVAALFQ
jgi:hypothetical protein